MTPEQFSKLPKFAQEEFTTLKRQRQEAVNALQRFQDSDTPSPIWIEDHVCDGSDRGPVNRRHYIQGTWLYVEYAGVNLHILLRPNGHQTDTGVIDLSYRSVDRLHDDVMFQPRSYQHFYLFKPKGK